MKIAVVIVSYNSSPDTIEAVRSVMASRTPNLWQRKIYVVENGSKKESEWEDLQGLKSLPGVELLKSGKNLGFTGGNNLATAEALSWGADFVLLLNTDTKVAADFLIE